MRETDKADEKGNIDEIKQYRDARWVTPLEALWRICGFDLGKNHPPVQQLQLHLPDMHMVAFHKRDKVERIVNRPGVDESMLTAYFDTNRLHEETRGILYQDFLEHFTWQSEGKFWQKRKNYVFQVGKVISTHPAEGERYFLCVLLNNIAGATSYEHLRTVDSVLLPSFREATERRGLIEEDNTLDECLTEATLFQMPSSLRRLFATILVFCEPHDVMGLWIKHYDAMSEDYSRNNPSPDLVQQMVLIDIRNMLQSMGRT
jgi:ATP-dependent DNA helicase PIF1